MVRPNKTFAAALAVTAAVAAALAVSGAPAQAQARYGYNNSYDREAFWRGAPDGLQQRIDWLQQRIDRGRGDGSIDPAEARRLQWQLDGLKRDANALQQRLDNVSRSIRWARQDGWRQGASGYGGGGYYAAPAAVDYDAARYYRDDSRYTERRLAPTDQVYRGSDGRYYCKRSDGTTGLIIGGLGGAALGNVIDGGHDRVAGTLIGGALGAFLGKTVDQNQDVRCR